ncbi:amyloid-beta A4 precursor protein-binding family A member 1-like isoform X2 [Polyodon spathula]|uniref:amyloid-beta A4 precursor protein-binding family A member 1-like isoform X2 n=1 Tax=Polyodon spathula TaxID=7913 RepID=UPI001B7F3E13|nr:amyloid-beta A4 precursor protein-binding family A member 1-like isoform X2 [Polyodon spathula]
MNHEEEAELEEEPSRIRGEGNEAAEAYLEQPSVEEEQHSAAFPVTIPAAQCRRQDITAGRENSRRRALQQQQNNNSEEVRVQHQQQQQPPPAARYRRFDASGRVTRVRGQRKPQEDTEVEQQQPLQRPAAARYRRQTDGEARIRAQQQRQRRQQQQREAEMVEVEQQQPSQPPPPPPPPPQQPEAEDEQMEEEEGGLGLTRSASTESGFHNHTDRAEGDMGMTSEVEAETALEGEAVEDENAYAVHYRPESEEYTESAEAEQHGGPYQPQPQPPPPLNPLPHFHPHEQDEEAMSAAYSAYVYTQRLFHGNEGEQGDGGGSGVGEGQEPYSEPYADYGLQEHVYEEIGDTPPEGDDPQHRRSGFRLFERESYRQEALGARLHHYDERSDGESDSPEKEAEFAPYPRMDSYDQEEDIDQIVAEVKQSMSSQSLDRAADEDRPESEQNSQEHKGKSAGEEEEESSPPKPSATSPTGEQPLQRHSKEKRDAISLAIKDIKEAIEEVKTRTIRSPYTPDEPKEPIWVMRQDISPTRDCDNQRPLDGESPDSGSTSPQGAESSITQHLHDGSDNSDSPLNKESRKTLASFPTYVEVPGPCDPEDLIDGIIFAANYLGSTQLLSDKTPSKSVRMMQAQEAVSRIKTPEGESQPMTEVDLFISTQRIKVLNADSQETTMDHPLRTISYIADIGNIVVLMARRKMPRPNSQEDVESTSPQDEKKQYKMVCHVFESEDAQLIAQSIGQAFSVAYQEFLRANGINPEDLSQKEYSDLLNTQDMYNDDLIHFSKSENCKDVYIEKQKGEILGVVIVESGWGSILPTVIIANMMHSGPAEKSGRVNIGDQIMSINGTSLVGLPLSTCQTIIKGLKNQSRIKLNIVRCPPVTTVLIRRPDLRYQLGFSVQNGIICSLMRGGIAERGGVRVGHRIIEINGQSVVATPHEKIVHILSNAVGEIHMKTMPAAMYRLLTAQEQPVYI